MTGLPVTSEKAVIAGIIYSALGSDGSGGLNGTRMSTSVGTVGVTTPSGTAGADVNVVPTVVNGGSAKSDAVGLKKYTNVFFVVVVIVVAVVGAGMVGI